MNIQNLNGIKYTEQTLTSEQKAQAAWPTAYQLLLAKVVQYDIINFDGISYHPVIRNS